MCEPELMGSLASKWRTRPQYGSGYRKVYVSTAISSAGDGVSSIAYPWLASAVTRNPVLVALVVAVRWLPDLFFVLPDTTGANTGDSFALPVNQSYECDNCSPYRLITAGSIVAGDTIEAPTTTSVSNWLLPVMPSRQQMRSLNWITPRVSATSTALRSCAMRWFENVRTWIVSANAFSSSPGCTGLRVTRMVLSRGARASLRPVCPIRRATPEIRYHSQPPAGR